MARSDIFIDMGYVPHWGVVEAIRELFQNAHDAEVSNAENKMFFKYDKKSSTLLIGNKLSVLSKKTLLIGCSSKRGKDDLIGEQGEGYKLATVVLLRTGHTLQVCNYGANEIWDARIIKSTKYKTNIASFDIKSCKPSKYDNSLVFKIGGITEDEFNEIIESNLYLLEEDGKLGKVHKTIYGDLLMDDSLKGKIFVEGLYVCSMKDFEYGYNLQARNVKLNRDRNLLDTFDIKWECSRITKLIPDTKVVNKAINSGEACYYTSDNVALSLYEPVSKNLYVTGVTVSSTDYSSSVYDECLEDFVDEYGDNAYPVCSESEKVTSENAGYTPVIVSEAKKEMILKSSNFNPVSSGTKATPVERLEALYKRIRSSLSDNDDREFKEILTELKGSSE